MARLELRPGPRTVAPLMGIVATAGLFLCALASVRADATGPAAPYGGLPYHDRVYAGGPQKIPGRIQCAYFDLGGEGVAYHAPDTRNRGSGALNPADGTYLNEFRMNEAVGISYVKYRDAIDDNPFNRVRPPPNQLYVGWTSPGEWIRLTVEVARAGPYWVDLLYTSNRGGRIALDVDGRPAAPAIDLVPTRDAAETVAWRQWHHWNLMRRMARAALPAGRCVLTLRIVTEGNMNLATLDFGPAD
ncbi:MAG TPA: hypothetical protein VGG37_01875 [Opitutaceae bacterium]